MLHQGTWQEACRARSQEAATTGPAAAVPVHLPHAVAQQSVPRSHFHAALSCKANIVRSMSQINNMTSTAAPKNCQPQERRQQRHAVPAWHRPRGALDGAKKLPQRLAQWLPHAGHCREPSSSSTTAPESTNLVRLLAFEPTLAQTCCPALAACALWAPQVGASALEQVQEQRRAAPGPPPAACWLRPG